MRDTQDGTDPAGDIAKPRTPILGAVGTISKPEGESHPPAPKPEQESTVDKAARRTATATVWIAIFTVVLAAVAALTLYFVITGGTDTHELAVQAKNQADRMKDLADRMKDQADRTKTIANQAIVQADAAASAAQIAAETLEVTQRPWITQVAEIGAPVMFSVNGASITFLFTLDNVGHTPAEKVWVEAKLINIVSSGTPSIEEHQRVCNGPATTAPKSFTLGETLFPGKPFSSAWSWTIPWNEIQGTRAPKILGPLLYGCIEYSYGLSTKRHSTPFRYSVLQTDGRLIVQDGGFNVSTKEIPPSMVSLRRDGILGQPAPN